MDPILLRPRDAAKVIGLSRSTVYELMAANQLPSVKVGAARLIPTDELRAWVKRQRADGATVGSPAEGTVSSG